MIGLSRRPLGIRWAVFQWGSLAPKRTRLQGYSDIRILSFSVKNNRGLNKPSFALHKTISLFATYWCVCMDGVGLSKPRCAIACWNP